MPLEELHDEDGQILGPKGITKPTLNDKTARESHNQVENLFSSIDKKLEKMKFGGIIEDSLKNSIFGVFGDNYGKHRERGDNKFLGYFEEGKQKSLILEEKIFRSLLYFNLPYD